MAHKSKLLSQSRKMRSRIILGLIALLLAPATNQASVVIIMQPCTGCTPSEPAFPHLYARVQVWNAGQTPGAYTIWAGNGIQDFAIRGNQADHEDGSYRYTGSSSFSHYSMDWDMVAKPDPFIEITNLTLVNKSSTAKTFDLQFTLPTWPSFSSGQMSATMSGVLSDLNLSGDAALVNGQWLGTVDSTEVLWANFGLSDVARPNGFTEGFGLTPYGPVALPSGVSTDMALRLVFDLSPGDQVEFNTSFEVIPTPLPMPTYLLGSALLVFIGFLRRPSCTSLTKR